jgi:hypothetical protein
VKEAGFECTHEGPLLAVEASPISDIPKCRKEETMKDMSMLLESRCTLMRRVTRPLLSATFATLVVTLAPVQAQEILQPWQYTSALNVARYYHPVVVAGEYVYAIGGDVDMTPATPFGWTNSVEYAAIQADGSLGPWQLTSALNTPRYTAAAAAADGYLYVMGGGPTVFSAGSSERAQILPDGSLGPWQLSGNLAVPRYQSAAVVVGGYLYLLGGSPVGGGIIASIERAAIMADGSLGPFAETAPLPVARTTHAAATWGGHVYVLGGAVADATYQSVIYADVLPDGSLGSWNSTSSLTSQRFWSAAGIVDGTLYAIGGLPTCTGVEGAAVQTDGSLGPWAATTAMQSSRCYASSGASTTHLYAVGGYDGTQPGFLASVEYATPIAPDTTITNGPPSLTSSTSATFTFVSNETGSTFSCQLDGGGFAACTSPKSYVGLSDGSHTFQVRATDNAGNTDPTPASSTWTVDTTPPDTSITSAVDGNGAVVASGGTTLSGSITFTIVGTDSVGVAGFQCSLDGVTFASCASPVGYSVLAIASHTFRVRAIDTAGNIDPSPASLFWTIVTPAQADQNLITAIGNMGLPTGVANGLIGPLKNFNPNNKNSACGKLNTFINQVNFDAQNGLLTPAQASQLLQAANAIKTSLGC